MDKTFINALYDAACSNWSKQCVDDLQKAVGKPDDEFKEWLAEYMQGSVYELFEEYDIEPTEESMNSTFTDQE